MKQPDIHCPKCGQKLSIQDILTLRGQMNKALVKTPRGWPQGVARKPKKPEGGAPCK